MKTANGFVICGVNGQWHRGACEKRNQIKSTTYIQKWWYVPPSGCTEGAYWAESEGQWLCKHCGHINRLIFEDEIFAKLKKLFKEVVDKYDN